MVQFLPRGGNWPHTVLIENDSAEALRFAREAAAALLCKTGVPDCECVSCRRVREGIHPDVILLDRGGKDIVVDDIRSIRQDAFVAPLEGDRKVYLILHAQDMNGAAQNAALKLLEEPPAGVYFVLLCDQAMSLLQTVRSRCVIFGTQLEGETAQAVDEETGRLAASFAAAMREGSELALLEFCMQNEKLKRAQIADFLDAVLQLLQRAIRVAVGAERAEEESVRGLSKLPVSKLVRMTELLLRRRSLNEGNVGAAHIMGTIPAEFFADK